ncbi:MAG: hisF2 [Bacteroidetes bacterium]|jgi:cyclase|nr:hisF2 [Bacteroidota bacterium]MDF2452270.1 hisF2 [Bacteroidota bacterium]
MFRPRIIPVLLLQNNSLIKSKRFTDFRYIGDPIHTVKIFNDLQVNELIFLDINATIEKRCISIDLIKTIGEEASMPFAVGGGIRTIENIKKIIANGAEKVIIGSYAAEKPDFIKEASERFGSSAISVCLDVKKNFFGKEYAWTRNGKKSTGITPETFAKLMEENGAGEIIIQSIEKDGLMTGYDIDLIKKISSSVTIPVIALGGAGNLSHLKEAYLNGLASGLAAGSLFVFQGKKHGVLINYPDKNELKFDT